MLHRTAAIVTAEKRLPKPNWNLPCLIWHHAKAKRNNRVFGGRHTTCARYVLNTITATSALRFGSSWTRALASVSNATCWQILKPCWRQNSSKSAIESERT